MDLDVFVRTPLRLTTETRVGLFVLSSIAMFIFIGLYIGSFRINHGNYSTYQVSFRDSAGVQKKGEVKIAGVKVGWIEHIQLMNIRDQPQAHITICIEKQFTLYADAYAIVKQDGILGAKFIEIVPGNPHQALLQDGGRLVEHEEQVICMDELIEQAQTIAHDVHEVSQVLKQSLDKGSLREEIDTTKQMIHQAAEIVSEVHRAHFGELAQTMQQFSQQAEENLKSVYAITQKIDQGYGSAGKLVNDTELYEHISETADAIHTWTQQFRGMRLTVDSYIEVLRKSKPAVCNNTKSFFNIRLHPRIDYFFQFQVIYSEKGFIRHQEIERITCSEIYDHPLCERQENFKKHWLAFGFQFGKIIRDVFAIRLGIIESTAGIAFDLKLPIPSNNIQWISTVELFDFRGFNQKNERRAHIKWLNRLILFKNIYFAFGADNIISHQSGRPFVGAGIFFNSDTINHFFPDYSG